MGSDPRPVSCETVETQTLSTSTASPPHPNSLSLPPLLRSPRTNRGPTQDFLPGKVPPPLPQSRWGPLRVIFGPRGPDPLRSVLAGPDGYRGVGVVSPRPHVPHLQSTPTGISISLRKQTQKYIMCFYDNVILPLLSRSEVPR